MEKTYYKVVLRDGDKLYSAWTKCQRLNRCVKEYAVGKQTRGRGTKLFIFDSFENAREWKFTIIGEAGEIYECKATGVENAPKYVPIIISLMTIESSFKFWSYIFRWWEDRTQKTLKGRFRYFQTAPGGTLVANSVTLLRKVL